MLTLSRHVCQESMNKCVIASKDMLTDTQLSSVCINVFCCCFFLLFFFAYFSLLLLLLVVCIVLRFM